MAILDDLKALGRDPRDPAAVVAGIKLIAADPDTRVRLAREWESASGSTLAPDLFASLSET